MGKDKVRTKPIMGDVVIVTKVAERSVRLEHEKDAQGYYHTRVFRVLRVYPTEPTPAVVVGMRDVHTGEVTDDEGLRVLTTYCKHRMWLVRTGPKNREVLVPTDGLKLANEEQAKAFRDELVKGRLLAPVPPRRRHGVNLTCDDEAELIKMYAKV